MKFTVPPALMVTSCGINSWWLRSRGERVGNLSRGGSVCHEPKLTVALARRLSSAITEGTASPTRKIATMQMIDSVECLISSSSFHERSEPERARYGSVPRAHSRDLMQCVVCTQDAE